MPAATSSSATSTAVDLSRLPPPDVVEALDYETIFAAMLAKFQAAYADFDALVESDPVFKVLEVAAYEVLTLRQRVNEAARACMIAYSLGGDLDNLAAIFGVTRLEVTPADAETGAPAVMESDAALRRRVLLAPDSYSVAGPTAAYIYQALSASGEVRDATAISPSPGEVLVTVLSTEGDGTPSAALLAAVEDAVAGDAVRPLTDQVTVQAAAIVPVAITAQLTLFPGPDSALVLQTALANLDELIADNRRLGRDVTRSALFAALHVAGVNNVTLTAPAEDIALDDTQAWNVTAIDVTIAGAGA